MRIFLKLTFFSVFIFCAFCKGDAQVNKADSIGKTDTTVFDKVEIEASFPGGPQAWTAYISKQIQAHLNSLGRKDYGTCIVRFIVDKTGAVRNVEATTMKKSKLAKVVIEAIEDGPKWTPAVQHGKFVNAYRLQPVTITKP